MPHPLDTQQSEIEWGKTNDLEEQKFRKDKNNKQRNCLIPLAHNKVKWGWGKTNNHEDQKIRTDENSSQRNFLIRLAHNKVVEQKQANKLPPWAAKRDAAIFIFILCSIRENLEYFIATSFPQNIISILVQHEILWIYISCWISSGMQMEKMI